MISLLTLGSSTVCAYICEFGYTSLLVCLYWILRIGVEGFLGISWAGFSIWNLRIFYSLGWFRYLSPITPQHQHQLSKISLFPECLKWLWTLPRCQREAIARGSLYNGSQTNPWIPFSVHTVQLLILYIVWHYNWHNWLSLNWTGL